MLDRTFLLSQALVECDDVLFGLHEVGLIPVIRRHQQYLADCVSLVRESSIVKRCC